MKKVLGLRIHGLYFRFVLVLAFSLALSLQAVAQTTIKGTTVDGSTGEVLSYVNIKVMRAGETKMLKSALSDSEGHFIISGLGIGSYQVQLSFVGYQALTQTVKIQKGKQAVQMGRIKLTDDSKMLKEVTVTGQRSAIKLEVDRKSYDVSQDIANIGASASEALENIPSVEVDQDGNISLRGSTSVEVWINGKASGLTSDNRGTILQQIPAESIERIEVIDNPSAKYSAEGSSGIINIILKRDRKAGFYGSLQAGGDTFGGANTNGNINFNSKWVDAYASIGFRHMDDESETLSNQDLIKDGVIYGYQNNDTKGGHKGNMLFTRAGVTFHASKNDDISLSGMFMYGKHHDNDSSPYYYGLYPGGDTSNPILTRTMTRYTTDKDKMNMKNIELNYRHNFSDTHFLELNVSHNRWSNDGKNLYQDTTVYADGITPGFAEWQYRPQNINNKSTEIKLDYENKLSDKFLLQAGYNGRFNRENTPQEAWYASNFDGRGAAIDTAYFNRFLYNIDIHAFYTTATLKFGKFGIMGGLRGEYWKVNTVSKDFYQEYGLKPLETPYQKDFFKLFPSVFATYQITKDDQLQLSYTRRLQRPWGGQMNSFMDTRSATNVSFGNPQLTPEYSNNYALNYLRTWTNHSLLVSGFFNMKTDVIQQVRYRIDNDDRTFQTNMNLAKRIQSGLELTAKNKLWRIVDITTTAQFYYNKIDGYNFSLLDPLYGMPITVSGDPQSQFSWKARTQISVMLPWDMSVQVKANYSSKEVIVQGERPARYGIDLGVRKSFFNKKLTIALNCRDLLDSRARITKTWSDSFYQYSKNRHHARKFNLTVTWAFGSNGSKKKMDRNHGGEDAGSSYSGDDSGGGDE